MILALVWLPRELTKFISRRKDTFLSGVHLRTQQLGVSLADQYSAGIALKTAFELYPESESFATSVMRGTLMAGSGLMVAGAYKRVP